MNCTRKVATSGLAGSWAHRQSEAAATSLYKLAAHGYGDRSTSRKWIPVANAKLLPRPTGAAGGRRSRCIGTPRNRFKNSRRMLSAPLFLFFFFFFLLLLLFCCRWVLSSFITDLRFGWSGAGCSGCARTPTTSSGRR